jgi:tRNA(adenine34) deaminase
VNGWDERDQAAMREALAEAVKARDEDEVPVGAVVVGSSGEIIGRGHNRSIANHDPSAHAEVLALREAATSAGNYRLPGATLYVTLEPCAMCVGAMLQARVARVVFGAYDERAGAVGSVVDLSMVPEFNHRIEVNGGLLADRASAILKAFFEDLR